jgi:hypothetical protein
VSDTDPNPPPETDDRYQEASSSSSSSSDGGGGMVIDEWRPVVLQNPVFTREEDEYNEAGDLSDQPDWCFLCSHEPKDQKLVGSRVYTSVRRFLYDNWPKFRGNPRWLCERTQQLYNEICRPHTEHKRPWYKRVMVAHITRHERTPERILESMLDSHVEIMRTLEDNGLKQEACDGLPGVRRVRIDPKTHAVYRNVAKECREIMNMMDAMQNRKARLGNTGQQSAAD